MKTDLYYLIPALILLWAPLFALVGGANRDKLRDPMRNAHVRFPQMLATPLNWIDLLRAAGGTWLLIHFALTADPTMKVSGAARLLLVTQMPVLLFGVILQASGTWDRLVVIGPTFYLIGVTSVVVPWPVAVFGLILGFTIAMLVTRFHWHHLIVAFSLVVAGLTFKANRLWLAGIVGFWLIPLVLGAKNLMPLAYLHAQSPVDRRGPRRSARA